MKKVLKNLEYENCRLYLNHPQLNHLNRGKPDKPLRAQYLIPWTGCSSRETHVIPILSEPWRARKNFLYKEKGI